MREMDNVALPEQANKYIHWYFTEARANKI